MNFHKETENKIGKEPFGEKQYKGNRTVLPRSIAPVVELGLQLHFPVVVDHVAVRTERSWSEEFAEEAQI